MKDSNLLIRAAGLDLQGLKEQALGHQGYYIWFLKSADLYLKYYRQNPNDYLSLFEAIGLYVEAKNPVDANKWMKEALLIRHRYNEDYFKSLLTKNNQISRTYQEIVTGPIQEYLPDLNELLRSRSFSFDQFRESWAKKAAEAFPGVWIFYFILYRIYRAAERNEEALEYADKTIEVSPRPNAMRVQKMILLRELRRISEIERISLEETDVDEVKLAYLIIQAELSLQKGLSHKAIAASLYDFTENLNARGSQLSEIAARTISLLKTAGLTHWDQYPSNIGESFYQQSVRKKIEVLLLEVSVLSEDLSLSPEMFGL
jgi:hypothetical protein